MSIGRILSEAHQDWVGLGAGVHIISASKLKEYQKQWGDRDTAKHLDLSQAPYWLQADGGDLIPLFDLEDVRDVLGGGDA